MDARMQKLVAGVEDRIDLEGGKPFVVSVMGQTGVGKSSLLNALFKTSLRTDPVRPCTREIQEVPVSGPEGHQLRFYDLPGLGEAGAVDAAYVDQYRRQLLASDVVLWAIHCDNRSVAFDLDALRKVLGADTAEQAHLMSKITFILTKVDLLTPPPWIFGSMGDDGVFAPSRATRALLERKQSYYQDTFIRPYGDLIASQTYNDGGFDLNEGPLSCDEYGVTYRGLLDEEQLKGLKQRYPGHAATFDRLYDNYRVIPCSSLFRFNLAQLMLVIVNKLGKDAIARFSNFTGDDALNRVARADVPRYSNLVILDPRSGKLEPDLAHDAT
jgi:GTP-binding protein EngB required for normal cell division